MNESLTLILALIAGMLLGVIFFAGLWWTVRRGVAAKNAAGWFFTSMLLRMSIVVLGFYFILGDDWHRLIAGLLGFVMARWLVLHFTRATEPLSESPLTDSAKDTRHAS